MSISGRARGVAGHRGGVVVVVVVGGGGCWGVEIYWGAKDAGIYRQTGERGVLECRNILGREGCRNL